MREADEVDVEQIMEQVRHEMRRRESPLDRISHDGAGSPSRNGQTAADLACLHALVDVQSVPLASHRPVLGPLVVGVKKVLRKLLTPILERQAAYNALNAQAVAQTSEWLGTLDQRMTQTTQALAAQIAALEQHQEGAAMRIEALVGQIGSVADRIGTVADRIGTVAEQVGSLAEQVGSLAEQVGPLAEQVGPLAEQVRPLAEQVEALARTLADASERSLDLEVRLREEFLNEGLRREALLEGRREQEMLALEARLRQEVQPALADLEASRQQAQAAIAGLWQALSAIKQDGHASRERVASAERKLRRILHALGAEPVREMPPRPEATPEVKPLAPVELEPEFDYAGFEERFRGTEADVMERQRVYLPYFEGRQDVLDIGCGRGEFLELLREGGIRARGVDLDLDMTLLCREKGLDVVMGDAFAHLKALDDGSLGGVFAAQVIEHLPPRCVIELVQLCHRKLGAGGVLILETPNPKCLAVFAESFYKDPSHTQPAHPDTMQFLLEAAGFLNVELRFSAPIDPSLRVPRLLAPGADVESFNAGIERLNALLFGFQDYAVIGRKGSGHGPHSISSALAH